VFILGLLICDICIYKLLMYHCLAMHVCMCCDGLFQWINEHVCNGHCVIHQDVQKHCRASSKQHLHFSLFDSTRDLNVQLLFATTKFNSYQLSSKIVSNLESWNRWLGEVEKHDMVCSLFIDRIWWRSLDSTLLNDKRICIL
jgi:hypothetical protein